MIFNYVIDTRTNSNKCIWARASWKTRGIGQTHRIEFDEYDIPEHIVYERTDNGDFVFFESLENLADIFNITECNV
jgi:hypothetical protein